MRLLLLTGAVCLTVMAWAQSNVEDVDMIQSIYGKEKKTIVAGFIQLQEAQKDKFWSLYDEYESKRKELGRERIALLQRYVALYASMDDATTDDIINQTIKLGAETDKLIATYFNKFERNVGAKPAAQFFQLEHYLLSSIRVKIFDELPFIGDAHVDTGVD